MVRARCIGLTSLRTEAVLLQSNASPHPVGAPAPGANGRGSVYWFDFASYRGGAPTIERVPPSCRSTRPGCEWYGLDVLVCLRFAPRRCSYNRTRHLHPVGAPAPGANGRARCIGLTRFAPRRCSYNRTRHLHPVGAPAPGANKAGSVYWFDSVRTEAVLLQLNASPPPCRSTRPGCERTGSVYWFDFASHRGGAPTIERATPPCRSICFGCERGRLGVLVCLRFAPRRCSYNRTRPPTCRSTRPGCEQTIARPTPRPAVRQTERTAPSLPRPL